jgi:hypothetical protein
MEANAQDMRDGAHERVDGATGALRERREDLMDRLDELSDAGEASWEEMKEGIDQATADLEQALDNARDPVREA